MTRSTTILLPILVSLFLATSSIPAGQPYIQFISQDAVLELPVSASTTQSLIDFDAAFYNVSPELMRGIIKRESLFDQYAENYRPGKEDSIGLVQINLLAHRNISRAQAENPVFSIDYLAKELSEGHGSMWSTYKAAKAADST